MLHVRSGLRMLCRRSCRFQWEGFSVRSRLTGHDYSQGLCPLSGVRVGARCTAFLAPCCTRFRDYCFCVHGKIINSVAQPLWTARKLGACPLPSCTLCVTGTGVCLIGMVPLRKLVPPGACPAVLSGHCGRSRSWRSPCWHGAVRDGFMAPDSREAA